MTRNTRDFRITIRRAEVITNTLSSSRVRCIHLELVDLHLACQPAQGSSEYVLPAVRSKVLIDCSLRLTLPAHLNTYCVLLALCHELNMSTMRAAVMHAPGGPKVLKIETLPIPTPSQGEVSHPPQSIRPKSFRTLHSSRPLTRRSVSSRLGH
jgi:hypothetical protein